MNKLDINKIRTKVEDIARLNNAKILKTGFSEKSDAIYINIQKPKEISEEYGKLGGIGANFKSL